ncbi:unnamed protein product [Rhodiola kirilowii]
MADKAKANVACDYPTTIKHFTEGISLAFENHVLYSNRSAAHASLSHYSQALEDVVIL